MILNFEVALSVTPLTTQGWFSLARSNVVVAFKRPKTSVTGVIDFIIPNLVALLRTGDKDGYQKVIEMRLKRVIYKVARFTGDHKYPGVYCILSNGGPAILPGL